MRLAITKDSAPYDFYIFKNCKKGKKCAYYDDGFFTCVSDPFLKLRKTGKSCQYDKDCYSGICSNGKCSRNGAGQTCKEDNNCAFNHYCGYKDANRRHNEKICMAKLSKDQTKKTAEIFDGSEYYKICRYGLVPMVNKDGDTLSCIDAFSIEDGQYCSSDENCSQEFASRLTTPRQASA